MSSEFLVAARFAVSGIAVGAIAATATDFIGLQALQAINLRNVSPTLGGNIGRSLASIVAGALISGAGVLAGEKLMNMMNPGLEDPLYRTIYYWSALNGSSLFTGSARSAKNLLSALLTPPSMIPVMGPAQPPKAAASAAAATASPARGCASCK